MKKFCINLFSHWWWGIVIAFLLVGIGIYGNQYLPEITRVIAFDLSGVLIDDYDKDKICLNHVNGYVKGTVDYDADKVNLLVRMDNPATDWIEIDEKNTSTACRELLGGIVKNNAYKLSLGAWIYILSTTLLIVLYVLKEASISIKIAEKEHELNKAILTTPPYEVTREFQNIIKLMAQYEERLASRVDDSVKDDKDKERYIRFCLDSIARIAKYFHNASDGHRFAANVMGVVSTELLLNDANLTCNLAKFSEYNSPDEIVNHEPRFLRLLHEFSSSTDDDARDSIDDGIQGQEVLLPIPADRKKALPGAVAALLSENLHDIILDCQNSFSGNSYPHLSSKVKSTLEHYFNNGHGTSIGSVLSIRLSDENDDKAIGVINIHSDLNEMFVNLDKRMMFIQLISPVLFKIHKLLVN
jgi:hypothetical protein